MLEHIAEISQNSLSEPVRCHELQETNFSHGTDSVILIWKPSRQKTLGSHNFRWATIYYISLSACTKTTVT